MEDELPGCDHKRETQIREVVCSAQLGHQQRCRQGEAVFRAGDSDRSLYIVESGLLAAQYVIPNGKQFTKSFFGEGNFVANIASITTGRPNTFSLVCLEDCSLIRVVFGELKALSEKDLAMSTAMNDILMGLAAKKERREYEFLCLTAEERYHLLRKSSPSLVKRVRKKDLASYLGITAVALSRIRARSRTSD